MVLTMATLLVTARQYIGDPIDCMVEVLWKYFQLAFLKLCLLARASLETSWTPTVGSIPPSPSQKGWSILYPQDQRCNIIIFLIKYLQHFLCSYIEHISQSTIFCDSFGRPSPTTLWTAARAPCCLLDANSPKNENKKQQYLWLSNNHYLTQVCGTARARHRPPWRCSDQDERERTSLSQVLSGETCAMYQCSTR